MSPDTIDENKEFHGNQLVMAKCEMVNIRVADGAISHVEQQEKSSDNQNICDNPVKMENEPKLKRSIVNEKNCEKHIENDDDRTSDTKVANASRSKLIYSCHRCKLIFNSRISFESHYK